MNCLEMLAEFRLAADLPHLGKKRAPHDAWLEDASAHNTLPFPRLQCGAHGAHIGERSSTVREIEPRLDYKQPHEPAGSAVSQPSTG
jgi:hypothetical protein